MSQQKKGELSAYWRRIIDCAAGILDQRIEEQQARTISPDYCLVPSDRHMMALRQLDLEAMQETRARLEKGGFWAKAIAFDTVLAHRPSILWG